MVDLGGGELGSAGNNRIISSRLGELRVINANPVAKNNWWGGALQGWSFQVLEQLLMASPCSWRTHGARGAARHTARRSTWHCPNKVALTNPWSEAPASSPVSLEGR